VSIPKVHSLARARADGWFERLRDADGFRELCDLLGERYVAFSLVLGVQVTGIAVDRRMPDASVVEFSLGQGGGSASLPLGELRRRLVLTMVDDEGLEDRPKGDAEGTEALQGFLGPRWVLLSPIYGMRLMELHVPPEGPAVIVYELEGDQVATPVEAWRERLRTAVRSELGSGASPFSIDLEDVPKAVAAIERGDFRQTISLLEGWPTALSILLRTADGRQLGPDVRATLAGALGALGTAYSRTHQHDLAEEVMRLGIQWAQDGPAGGELFYRLADAHVRRGKEGEAIGLLRRAMDLGVPRALALPLLARCFAARGKYVAAAACVLEAEGDGVSDAELREVRTTCETHLGAHWARFVAALADGA
jgi:hypothetical protein